MSRLVTAPVLCSALLALIIAPGCTKVTSRSDEGQACSTSGKENPQFICNPATGLVCVTTHNQLIGDAAPVPVFECRIPCAAAGEGCTRGDVCCPAASSYPAGSAAFACVPASACGDGDPDAGVTRRDAGSDARDGAPRDTAADSAGPSDAPSDAADSAARPDAAPSADAPMVTPDASGDAPADL